MVSTNSETSFFEKLGAFSLRSKTSVCAKQEEPQPGKLDGVKKAVKKSLLPFELVVAIFYFHLLIVYAFCLPVTNVVTKSAIYGGLVAKIESLELTKKLQEKLTIK